MANADGDEDGGRGSPPAAPVEALSTGRARRATAGNRMRELLEQERERILAEGEDEAAASKQKVANRKESGGDKEDEDAIFKNEDDDIDFEAREDAEDVIDSDFDLSSDQGEEDEEEGERELQAEEKAAKKARAKAKPMPGYMRRPAPARPALATSSSQADDGDARPVRSAKRISFASNAQDNTAGQGTQRSSKRKATMEVTQTVQARVKADEERRARQSEVAQPKRKKVRISQADYIAEALEMEERNRESLKVFLEREEERRERDRKRGKKKIEGPFLRWRSTTIDRKGASSRISEVSGPSSGNETSLQALTLDPVFAAREAAVKERQAREAAKPETQVEGTAITQEDQILVPNNTPAVTRQDTDAKVSSTQKHTAENSTVALQGDEGLVNLHEGQETNGGRDFTATESAVILPKQPPAVVDALIEASNSDITSGTQAEQAGQESSTSVVHHEGPAETQGKAAEDDARSNAGSQQNAAGDSSPTQIRSTLAVPQESGREARAYVSLHDLPASTPWPVIFSHILGSHVDWSRYPIVPARNRPLRPRQSVCPITGLPAKYRDPRNGIAFANCEAYENLSRVMQGGYRWSGKGLAAAPQMAEEKSAIAAKHKQTPRYDPLEMGCFMDRLDERGANDVVLLASTAIGAQTDGRSIPGIPAGYLPRGALAPGDEQALVAAAQALPAGTTRSGGRRSTAK